MSAELELKAWQVGGKKVLEAAQALVKAALGWDDHQTAATHDAIAELRQAEAYLAGALEMAKAADAPTGEVK